MLHSTKHRIHQRIRLLERLRHQDRWDNHGFRCFSTALDQRPSTDPKRNGIQEEEDGASSSSSSSVTRASLYRLAELSRPEWGLIAKSAATLGVTSSVTLLLPYASGHVIDATAMVLMDETATTTSATSSPLVMAVGLFGLTSLSGLGVYLRTLWLSQAGNRVVARLRQQVFWRMLQQEMAHLDTVSTGDWLSRLASDAQLIQTTVTTQAIAALRGVVVTAGSIAMLTYTSPTLATVSLCTLPPILVSSRIVGRRLQEQQTIVQEQLARATGLAEQTLGGMATVKQHHAAEEYEAHRYRNAIAQAHQTAVQTAHMQAQLEGFTFVGANGAVLGVLGYGGNLVLQGAMTAGDLTGFVMYSVFLAGNLSNLATIYADLSRAVAAADRVLKILDRQPQIPTSNTSGGDDALLSQDPLDSELEWSPPPLTSSTRAAVAEPMTVEIRNLSFSYPARPNNLVLGPAFSLRMEAGQVVALVGRSGSGKSTLAGLLTRLYEVPPETIFLNGKCLQQYNVGQLRRLVGVVPQEPWLFRGTVAENIRYGQWEAGMDKEVEKAAALAHVQEFVQQQDMSEHGLETEIGPTQLSGGQKQRIAIARTILQNPPLVILDEATSALDARSESLVQEAMHHIQEGRTVLSIAHRLSTIRHADTVAVLDNGVIVQQGTFDELANDTNGAFWNLMKTQLLDDNNTSEKPT